MDPFVFGCVVFGSGAAMMGLHYDADFRQKFQDLSDNEAEYHKRQYLRRMIASGMITLIGILFMIYQYLPQKSIIRVWMIGLVLILVGCVVVLGVMDFGSITRLLAIQRQKSADSAKELADELVRIKKKRQEKAEKEEQAESAPDNEPDSD